MNRIVRSIVFSLVAFAVITAVSAAGNPADQPFLGSWSAGQLLARHHNPYDSAALLATERAQGLSTPRPARNNAGNTGNGNAGNNPPWTLLLVYPLGLVSARTAWMLWMGAALTCLALCLHVPGVARLHRILAYCFAPVFACLAAGAMAPLVLLGFSLFVLFYRSRPLVAGASVLLLSLEPHLLVVLAPVVLLDCIYRRNGRLAAGAAAAFALASALALKLDPAIFSQYTATLREALPRNAGTPAMLRSLVAPRLSGLEWLPCLLAVAWALCWYWSRRRTWNWQTDTVPLLFVTMLVAPSASVADQVLLLPAVLATLSSAKRARYAATSFFAINAAALNLVIAQGNDPAAFNRVTAIAWFAWYLYSRGSKVEARAARYQAALVQA